MSGINVMEQIIITSTEKSAKDLKSKVKLSELLKQSDEAEILYSSGSDCEYELVQRIRKLDSTEESFKYSCKTCAKKFRAIESLVKHLKVHEVNNSVLVPIVLKHDPRLTNKTNRVKVRKNRFRKKKRLNMKAPAKVEMFKCSVCDLSINSDDLGRHMASHTKLTCTICGKLCKSSWGFSIHTNLHAEKPFACGYCPKNFQKQEQLDAHIKKHVFEKPMECPLCNRFFTERADYKEHIQFHRNVRELSCGICSVEFKSDAAIAKHIVEEHGESDGKIEFEVVPDFDEGDAQ